MKTRKKTKHSQKGSPVPGKSKVQPETPVSPSRYFERQAWGVISAIAFFLVYGACLWKWIDVGLIYHGSGQVQDFPSFYWGWEFVRDFTTHPGGFIEYASAFLAQALCFSWFGALALTLQAAAVYLGITASLRIFKVKNLHLLGIIPPLLFLGIYSKYRHYSVPVSSFTVGVLVILGWLWARQIKVERRLVLAFALASLLYAAAPSALEVFVPAVIVCELAFRAPVLKLLVWTGLVCLIPGLEGRALFGFAPGEAYLKLLPMPWDHNVLKMAGIGFVILLYSLSLLFCLGAGVWLVLRKTPQDNKPDSAASKTPVTSRNKWRPFELAVLAALPMVVVFLTLRAEVRKLMRADYYAWHGQWDKVLASVGPGTRNPYLACVAAQASYHTGTLTTQLPSFVAPGDLILFSDKQQSHWKKSDLYFDLGYLNMALHHLTESVEFYGERPVLLQRLALVNLALGNVTTAQVYLGTLARAPFQRNWAEDYLQRLQIDPTLSADPEIARLRRSMVKRDSVVSLSPEEELLMLLGADRQNRMAFEYLMTYYLLSKNLNGFVKNISRVNDFSALPISPLWDEALVLASRLAGRTLQIQGHVINPDATARVETVTRLVQQYGDKTDQARRKLSADYGHTYTFYWWFHE